MSARPRSGTGTAAAKPYGFLTGCTIFRKASMRSLRLGTGISWPLRVFCVGAGCSGCCTLSSIRGEVSAHGPA